MAMSLARAVPAVVSGGGQWQDVDQGRGCGEGTVACSCSAWGARAFHKSGNGEVAKLGIPSTNFTWTRGVVYHGSAYSKRRAQLPLREGGSRGPVCLTRGVNGAFWEGADSESTANVHFTSADAFYEKKEQSVLLSLIQEIEPLDLSTISKDASSDSTGAMKRTISGMLGLLPSDQFQVSIETTPDHLARLLVSSMMTGYTLRNAEYRLCLQRSLDLADEGISDSDICKRHGQDVADLNVREPKGTSIPLEQIEVVDDLGAIEQTLLPAELGPVSSEVANYIQQLQEKLSATSKELEECKNAVSSLEIVKQEKNDLLDYLRSLEPEKVAELSQPSPEVHEVVEHIVAGLLGTMIPKPSQVPPFTTSSVASPWEECRTSEVVEKVPLQFQSTVTSSRDYLARLLFWCTLLGYHMRGLEYRLELSRTLSLSGEDVLNVEEDTHDCQ